MIRRDKFSVYFGSGIVQRQFGDWKTLVTDLCKACHVPLDREDQLTQQRMMELADEAYKREPEVFKRLFYNKFGKQLESATPDIYRWIIGLPFRSVFTTNFDHNLADLNRTSSNSRKLCKYPNLPPTEVALGGVFYLHGKPDRLDFHYEDIVLGGSSFCKAYQENSPLRQFLTTVWLYENIVFLGCQLAEPPLRELLRAIAHISARRELDFKVSHAQKLMVVGQSEITQEGSKFPELSSLGFQLLTYQDAFEEDNCGQHDALHAFFEEVSLLAFPAIPTEIPPWTTP